MDAIIDSINSVLWATPGVFVILAIGLFFSVKTKFLQMSHFRDMFRLMKESHSSDEGVSSLQSLLISVGSRVGTGNIAGVATAIALGGPGSVFWMWVAAFLGSANAFVESTLSQIFKVEQDGQYRGGPAFYIEKGLGSKVFAVIFAIAAIVALGALLPQIQSSTAMASLNAAFGGNVYLIDAIYAALFGCVIFGGIKRIAKTAELIVPFMALGYIIIVAFILLVNYSVIPGMLEMIVSSAIGTDSLMGGMVGAAVTLGVKRGIYSNEAGIGTAAHHAGAAEVSHPVKQGIMQALSVLVDTIICTATAILILSAGTYNIYASDNTLLVENLPGVDMGAGYAQAAVDMMMPGFGSIFIALSVLFFTFTSLIAFFYIAETNLAYLAKGKFFKVGDAILKIFMIITTFYGGTITASKAWAIGDVGIGLLMWINFTALVLLYKPTIAALRDYEQQEAMGLDPVFIPSKLGIKNADYWDKRTAKVPEQSTKATNKFGNSIKSNAIDLS